MAPVAFPVARKVIAISVAQSPVVITGTEDKGTLLMSQSVYV